MLALEFGQKHSFRKPSEDISSGAVPVPLDVEGCNLSNLHVDDATIDRINMDYQNLEDPKQQPDTQTETIHGENDTQNESEDVELGDFFVEDTSQDDSSEVSRLQRKEKLRYSEKNLEGFWKKVYYSSCDLRGPFFSYSVVQVKALT